MKKAVIWAMLFTLPGWARPYNDGVCQVQFPGNFSKIGHTSSASLPHIQLHIISWTTPPDTATAMLRQLYKHSDYRGVQTAFVSHGRAQGLQLVESLPLQKTQSQYFLTYGVCYEFRASSDDDQTHPEINAFFDSIRFSARTVNLKRSFTVYPPPPRYYPPGPANPYEF